MEINTINQIGYVNLQEKNGHLFIFQINKIFYKGKNYVMYIQIGDK